MFSADTDIATVKYITTKDTIQFHDMSDGNPLTGIGILYHGSISYQQNPKHNYKKPGNYSVKLKIGNGFKFDSIKKIYCINVREAINDVNSFLAEYSEKIKLSPNPAQNSLNIHINQEYETPTHIRIFDILGRQVGESEIQAGRKEEKIDINGLSPGIYFLNLQNGVVNETLKLIKN